MNEIIQWSAARDKGLKKYFSGKPCPMGHICQRWVSSKVCLECRTYRHERDREKERLYAVKRRESDPEFYREKQRVYAEKARRERPELVQKWRKDFVAADPQRIRNYASG